MNKEKIKIDYNSQKFDKKRLYKLRHTASEMGLIIDVVNTDKWMPNPYPIRPNQKARKSYVQVKGFVIRNSVDNVYIAGVEYIALNPDKGRVEIYSNMTLDDVEVYLNELKETR